MALWFGGALALLAIILLARLALEWRRYASGRHVISRRQMTLRFASAVDLVLLLALIVFGTQIRFPTAEAAFTYWAGCVALATVAMAMAVMDLRLLRRTSARRRAESYQRLSAYIRQVERSRRLRVPPQ